MRVGILALDGTYLSCVSSALDVVQLTRAHGTDHLRERDPLQRMPSWAVASLAVADILSLDGQSVKTSCGIALKAAAAIGPHIGQYDTVFVPAFFDASDAALSLRLTRLEAAGRWLRNQKDNGATIVANNTGVFVLAKAGILDEAVATIPLAREAVFRRHFPRVKLDLTRAVSETQSVVCGAAIGSTFDLMRRYVQRSNSIVRRRVFADLFYEGTNSLAGLSAYDQDLGDPMVERALSYMVHHLADKITLAELADWVSTTERTLFRRFKDALGVTPHSYLKTLRLETAKRSLARTEFRIDQIATSIGYTDPAFFAQQFRALTGLSPTAYRERFSTVGHGVKLVAEAEAHPAPS